MKSKSKCPSCSAVLAFDRANHSVVKCPKCNYKGKVADFPEIEETVVPGDLPGKIYKPGKLELIETDAEWLQKERTVNLHRGINTLGRMSPASTGNVQLPTNDSFMSKKHATVDVIMKQATGIFEHRLSDNGSMNGTFHNGDRLEKGDVIKLMPNDIIKMGHTFFKFITE